MTLIDLFRRIPPAMRIAAGVGPLPPHMLDAIAIAQHHDARVSERKMRREQFGCCPCGFVNGEDYCPWCDDGIPTKADTAAREQRDADRREAVRKVIEALTSRPKVDGVPLPGAAPRAPNRFERRRAASRRWRG